MLIYIVRHAWAEERDAERWPDDDLRPLTRKGARRFGKVARRLARRGLEPRLIATSPLVRCRQTADILASADPDDPAVEMVEALQPGTDLDAVLRWTAAQSAEAIAWVGHGPDVGEITAALIGGGAIDFPKGAAAAIRFERKAERGKGELLWLVTARLLGIE